MKFSKEEQLNKDIKDRGIAGAYLLYGSEEYLIRQWRAKLVAAFEEGGFNFSRLDGQQLDLNEVYDATQQLPLFSPNKCVSLDNIDIKKLVTTELKKLEQIFQELPKETVFVITAPLMDSKLATAKKLIAMADKYGVATELSPRNTAGLVKYLQSIAKKNGCSLDSGVAKEMIRLCGNNMQMLTTEMGKVVAYAGHGEITNRHMEAMVTPNTEEKVFDLSKMILAGNTQRAMEIVANLIYLRENPIMIISTLIMSYADLYRAKIAKDQGENVDKVIGGFGYRGREFRAKNAFNTRMSVEAIRQSLELLYRCDRQMKSTMIDDTLLLEKTVVELISIRNT